MVLQLAVNITADASSLKREAQEARTATEGLGAALDAAGSKAAGAAGKFDAAGAAAGRIGGGAGGPVTPPGSQPAPPGPRPAPIPAPQGFRRDQWQNLSYQGTDVVSSLAMGMPLTQVLMQQGPQVAQVLGDAPGGIAGGFKIIGERVASILTPVRLLTGGMVGLGATFATLGYQWASSQKEIEAGLTGIGAMSRATAGDINRIAETAASGNRLSTGEARGVATAIASTGKVDVSNIGAVAGLAPGYAQLFGKSIEEAGSDLARIFADPIKGAEELNARMGGLDGTTRQYIRTLVEQGDRQEAVRVLAQKFFSEIDAASQKTSNWSKAWNWLSSKGEGIGSFVVQPFVTKDTEQQLFDARSRLRQERDKYGIGFGADDGGQTAPFRAEVQRLEKQLAAEQAGKRASFESKRVAELASQGEAAVRALQPEIEQREQLRSRIEQLTKVDGDAAAKAGMSAEARRGHAAALDRARGSVETFMGAQDRARASEALTVRSIEVRTAAEKAAVEAERERLALAGQAISADDRRQRIEAARRASFAQSTREAQDRLRSAEDAAAGAGLVGYPRRQAEIAARERRALEAAQGNLPAYSATQAAFGIERRAAAAEAINGPLRDADRSITEQAAGLRIQQAAFGASTEAAERMAAVQQLVNRYTADGVPVEGDLRRAIEERATATGKLAAAQDDLVRRQRTVVGSMDDMRYGLRGGLTGALGDVVNGRNPLDSLTGAAERTALSLFERQVAGPLVSGLLGDEGKPGGGLLGDTLGGLFGKAAGLPTADITAGVVNLSGPISGIGALAGAAANGNTPGGSVASLVGAGLPGIGGKASTFGGGSAEAASGILSRLSGSRSEVAEYVRQAAISRGIDPNVALRVVNQESGFNTLAQNLTSKEQSYGVMQLNTMGGLGVDALKAGIDVRDPSTWRQQVDFGFDTIKRDGWRQWYGARDIGVSRWEGIGQGAPAAAAPAASAVAPLSGLDASLGAINGSAARAAEGVAGLSGDLTALPGPLAQTAQGLTQVSSSLGSSGGGGGLLNMLASLFSGGAGAGAGAAAPTVAAATGGLIRGPGTGTSDSFLARLSDREFVVNAQATAQHLPLLRAINDNRALPAFADGGLVGMPVPQTARPEVQERAREAGSSGPAAMPDVKFVVENKAGVEVRQEKRRTASGGLELRAVIEQMVGDTLSKPGSSGSKALENSWGLSRVLTGR